MSKNKRFELTIDEKGYASIIDWVESEEKNAHCIYNDLGVIPFTSAKAVCNKLNEQEEQNQQLKKELKRCREWINSDKNDYELTLAFIKNKGYSLQDVLEYEKRLGKGD